METVTAVYILRQPAAWDGGDFVLSAWWDCVCRDTSYDRAGKTAQRYAANGYTVKFVDNEKVG